MFRLGGFLVAKNTITRFLINEAGQIEVLDFKQRTFKQALKPFLKKGWKHDPDKLLAAMNRSSDLRDAVIVIRDAYLEHFEKLSDELLVRLCETRSPQDNEDDLEETYQDLLAVTVLLSEISTKSLSNWVRTLSAGDYGDLIEELRIFLVHEVTENFHAWDAAVDTPQGQAVTLLMDLAPDDQDAFEFELVQNEDASTLCFATTKTPEELNAIARESGLDIEFLARLSEKAAGSAARAAAPATQSKTEGKNEQQKKRRKTVRAGAAAKAPQAQKAGRNAGKTKSSGKTAERSTEATISPAEKAAE